MVFSSVVFLCLFLPIVLLSYYVLPKKLHNLHLLFFSLVFYSWGNLKHLALLIVTILINYHAGVLLQRFENQLRGRKAVVICAIILNMGLLVYYKYFNFICANVNRFFNIHLPFAQVVLPIGISFFIFQGVSYVIDVYRNNVKANLNLLDVALYISLFPQLIAGPIVRYIDVQKQIYDRKVTIALFSGGVQRFIIGLSKKVVLADTLGNTADNILSMKSGGFDTPTAWLALLCYTFQIYFDFSGYSDMAIGLGRMFGFEFLENFNYPYISKSVTEFWRRWHISLSTWFKEYLYIPLGGNRRGNVYLNLFIVFCATGIWHGASWNFLLWGIWHGFFLIVERLLIKHRLLDKIPAALRWMYTMFVVLMGWALFRLEGFTALAEYAHVLFGGVPQMAVFYSLQYYLNKKIVFTLIIAIVAATPFLKHLFRRFIKTDKIYSFVIYSITLFLLVFCLSSVFSGNFSPFIYFRF